MKTMELARFISLMADSAQRIRALADGVSEEQARWKPDQKSWSILEVVNHLLDEEHEDFRAFLDIALHRPDEPRPKIAPEAWVTERRYNGTRPWRIPSGLCCCERGVDCLVEGPFTTGLGGDL
jgi:hypothetical protein